jgi:anti-sigma factor RsiW
MYPYLDGELSISDNQKVEEHVLDCQECSEILASQKRFLAMLDTPILRENGPAELKAIISKQLEPKKRFRFQLPDYFSFRFVAGAAFATAMLTLIVASFFTQEHSSLTYIQSTVASHRDYIQGEQSLEIINNNPIVVAKWLEEQIGIKTVFPEFDDQDIVLLGARIGQYKQHDVGLLSYKVHNTPVTLAITQKTSETGIESTNHTQVRDRRINFRNSGDFNVVSWSVCATNYALVSNLPQKGKESCAVCHADGSGLIDLSDFYARKT